MQVFNFFVNVICELKFVLLKKYTRYAEISRQLCRALVSSIHCASICPTLPEIFSNYCVLILLKKIHVNSIPNVVMSL